MIEQMLRQRSGVLYELNVYDDDTSRLLTAFNDRLRKACTELYKRVMAIYNEYSIRGDNWGEFEVGGKIFLCFEYPKRHPIQTENAKQEWEALTQVSVPLYDDGCAWALRCSKKYSPLRGEFDTMENGLEWKTRTITGMKASTENGRKICI